MLQQPDPKGPGPRAFKFPGDMRKYNGQEDRQIWLEDYLAAIICGNGNRTMAMQ